MIDSSSSVSSSHQNIRDSSLIQLCNAIWMIIHKCYARMTVQRMLKGTKTSWESSKIKTRHVNCKIKLIRSCFFWPSLKAAATFKSSKFHNRLSDFSCLLLDKHTELNVSTTSGISPQRNQNLTFIAVRLMCLGLWCNKLEWV